MMGVLSCDVGGMDLYQGMIQVLPQSIKCRISTQNADFTRMVWFGQCGSPSSELSTGKMIAAHSLPL